MDRNHEGWIEVLSIAERISLPAGDTSGTTRTRGSVVFEDVELEKFLDKTSPVLREKLARGEHFPKVDIDITKRCGDSEVIYFSYEFVNAQLSSISLEGMSAGGARPTEDFSLNFEEIKWTYTTIEPDCSSGGKVEAIWRLETGE